MLTLICLCVFAIAAYGLLQVSRPEQLPARKPRNARVYKPGVVVRSHQLVRVLNARAGRA